MIDQDTICAVSTPPGEGGIGIIRVSGPHALALTALLFKPHRTKQIADAESHTIHYGRVFDPDSGEVIDEALVSIMHAPATYTREDVAEFNCHGGIVPLRRTMELLIKKGARQAEPGEFTRRAFLNGRIDLTQAEAVMDTIRARTDLCLRAANEQLRGGLSKEVMLLRDRLLSILAAVEAAVDFPEEDIETETGAPPEGLITDIVTGIDNLLTGYDYGRILRDGFATAIVGRPNVGKSSLLNALLRQDRAIVTDIPGTTRDVLEEYVNVSGIPLRILDTAGIRHSHDIVEQEGVRRSLAAIESADLVLVVLDGSLPLTTDDRRVLDEVKVKGGKAIAVINKSDLNRRLESIGWPETQVSLSCRSGDGLKDLRKAIADKIYTGAVKPQAHAWAVNQRHRTALAKTRDSLTAALASVRDGRSPEFIAVDLRGALDSLGLITGATHTEDILERIFNDFCIGK